MKNTYYGSYNANGNTTNPVPYEYSNLKTARKSMREIAKGETFEGNSGHWWIENQYGETVAEGWV